jgi:formylglycine-generating enzyme required for sulfatase activity
MKKWAIGLAVAAGVAASAGAWRPAGWVYHDYPWAYDAATGDWYWFNAVDAQWVVRMDNGQWARWPDSALASGWVHYEWAFAYGDAQGAWHWINGSDVQWVANMRTGGWSRFGVSTVPQGMALVPRGTNTGSNPMAPGEFATLSYPETYSIAVEAFYVDRTEVTKALWDSVEDWSAGHGYDFDNEGLGVGPDHPVHSVDWYDCAKWCNARSEKEGRAPAYYEDAAFTRVYRSGRVDDLHVKPTGGGYRLPTLDQWEYAARGGATGRRYAWGDEINHDRANYGANGAAFAYDTSPYSATTHHPDYDDGSKPYTAPAGSFAANGYGLYDVAGNVWEWCESWHPGHVGVNRAIRGGAWGNQADYCRVGFRHDYNPAQTYHGMGFRTVLPLD